MKTALIYPYICNKAAHYRDVMIRFSETLAKFPAGADYDLIVTFCGGSSFESSDAEYFDYAYDWSYYYGEGWDIGSHQHAANALPLEYDFMICCCAHTYFWREGWLERVLEAREKNGPGLYGAMASNENHPHIRTCFFGVNPSHLRAYPWVINSREKSLEFESGPAPNNFTFWMQAQGWPAFMVGWDGVYSKDDWRKPANIFRRGDQSNCLVWDRHTLLYQQASPEQKTATEGAANG